MTLRGVANLLGGGSAATFTTVTATTSVTTPTILLGYTTTATAAGTTTLTVSSNQQQYFTGTTTQTVTLPVASTMTSLGQSFLIANNSTGDVTVNSSGGNAVQVMEGSTVLRVTCILFSGTTAASWTVEYETANATVATTLVSDATVYYPTMVASALSSDQVLDVTATLTYKPTTGLGIGATATNTFDVTRAAIQTSGVQQYFKITPVADTGLTASTEVPVKSLASATRQWATGALTTQRESLHNQPTYAFVGSSTITDAATIGIVGAPIKGTNASITNAHGLLISAGAVSTATNSYGLTCNAQTGATNNFAAQFNGVTTISNVSPGYTTTATAAGTTTLTVSSNQVQFFTGTTTQTVTLPVASTMLALGNYFIIENNSTGVMTINSSGANLVQSMAPLTRLIVSCILLSGTTAASWDAVYASTTMAMPPNVQTGTTYTLVAADLFREVTFNNASAITVTFPQQSTLATAAGSIYRLHNIGAGTATMVKEGAETLVGNPTLITNASCEVRRPTTTKWEVVGATATVTESFTVAFSGAIINDQVYDIVSPNYAGTIIDFSVRSTSLAVAGTYTGKIGTTAITGISAIANSATRTVTAATAANTFVSGDVINWVPTGTTTLVDAYVTVRYTRVY